MHNSRFRAAVNKRRAPFKSAHFVYDLFAHQWLEKIFDNKEIGPRGVVCLFEARVGYLDVATVAGKRSALRARAFSASTLRSRGGEVVTSESSNSCAAFATCSTARLNASSFAFDGLL